MRKAFVVLLQLVLACCSLFAQPISSSGPDSQLFAEIEGIVAELSDITGLSLLNKLEYDSISSEEVRRFLEQRFHEEVTPEELRTEELLLKKFGFAPVDFDLEKTTLDLLTEQAAAFYDYRMKKLFVLESAPWFVQQTALVHELAHALADQHFNLEEFADDGNQNDDEAAARMAVMEGQATWLMAEYMARRSGQSLKTSPAILDLISGSAAMSAGQYPVFDKAPLYMRESLLFPYTVGMRFQHAVIEKKGQPAFSEVFQQPPSSTQQILHPELYFAKVVPTIPSLPALSRPSDYEELLAGSIGEFDHEVLLRQYVGEATAKAVSVRWRGGQYGLLAHKENKQVVLSYVSEWDTPAAAREFFGHYGSVMKGKWKSYKITSSSEDVVKGRGDDGFFVLRLSGNQVSSLEGLRSPQEAE